MCFMRTPQPPTIPLFHIAAAPDPARRYRLLEQVRRGLRVRHYSRRTEVAYCGWIRRFVLFHALRHPSTMGEVEIAAFLNYLATKRAVSASTQNQALHALLFLYRHMWLADLFHASQAPPSCDGFYAMVDARRDVWGQQQE